MLAHQAIASHKIRMVQYSGQTAEEFAKLRYNTQKGYYESLAKGNYGPRWEDLSTEDQKVWIKSAVTTISSLSHD
jgi:hypothetical protein